MKSIENILGLSALILSIVNALFLLRQYARDKPKLKVSALSPKDYQWYFEQSTDAGETQQERKIGFLVYIGVSNSGLRATTIEEWQLIVQRANRKKVYLDPLPIPHPELTLSTASGNTFVRKFSVLGMASEDNNNPTYLLPGSSVSGWAYYYLLDGIADSEHAPMEKERVIPVEFIITDVFGKKTKLKISMNRISLDVAKNYIRGIDEMR